MQKCQLNRHAVSTWPMKLDTLDFHSNFHLQRLQHVTQDMNHWPEHNHLIQRQPWLVNFSLALNNFDCNNFAGLRWGLKQRINQLFILGVKFHQWYDSLEHYIAIEWQILLVIKQTRSAIWGYHKIAMNRQHSNVMTMLTTPRMFFCFDLKNRNEII